MILFKACPRCGGDVDTSHADDVRCIQCAHRPDPAGLAEPHDGPAGRGAVSPCPRCESTRLVPLDRLRASDNHCYRCRPCGHVFSPALRHTA